MRIILFLFIMTLSFTVSKAQWVELDPGVNDALLDIYAITPDIVIAVGANGTIIKTTDGGETWQQKESGANNALTKLQFPTPDVGYVIGVNGIFLKTIDGGETWFHLSAGTDCFYQNISCVDENLIFVICNGILIKSTDGGENWNEIGSISGNNFQFLSDEIGYMMTPSQGLFRTENGSEDWIMLDTYYGVFQFLDENVGFLYSADLYKTMDGGYNFESFGSELGLGLYDFFVVNENISWGILEGLLDGDGSTKGILKTEILEDGTYLEEINWDDGEAINMNSIHFANENTGYIVGYNDWKTRIWKNSTGINTMNTTEQITESKVKIYPNPVSEVLNIDFGKTISDINIVLCDITGKQLFFEKHKDKSKISFNTNNLSKGVYILSVYTGSQKFTKKIIIC